MQRPAAAQLGALEPERRVAAVERLAIERSSVERRVLAVVPDDHARPLVVAVRERVVRHLDREPFLGRVQSTVPCGTAHERSTPSTSNRKS